MRLKDRIERLEVGGGLDGPCERLCLVCSLARIGLDDRRDDGIRRDCTPEKRGLRLVDILTELAEAQ